MREGDRQADRRKCTNRVSQIRYFTHHAHREKVTCDLLTRLTSRPKSHLSPPRHRGRIWRGPGSAGAPR
ncbi:hypothetical protein EVAR_56813_1 [Eumeta japonica]|uniref:Uncharacterized protein n=1 Tax=Eumeta variegata TaxID=151549 RepID=A0A4C1Y3Y8_EUMVA|nr:hypothetical protein EVAR_56813_1 [Eumeta japonica]